MSILDKIVVQKQSEVAQLSGSYSLAQLQGLAERGELEPRGFVQALLSTAFPAVIAEIKRASPSKGVLCESLDPVAAAQAYQAAGAACLSVLTDIEFFHGSLHFLAEIRQAGVSVPLLRKDFLIDPLQVWESRLAGADAVLLIVAILSDQQLQELLTTALEAKLDVLIEVHTQAELQRLLGVLRSFDSKKLQQTVLLGINNRDLHSFETDIAVTERLLTDVDLQGVAVVSESGLKTSADLLRLRKSGVEAFLIGESLIVTGDCGAALKSLIAGSR